MSSRYVIEAAERASRTKEEAEISEAIERAASKSIQSHRIARNSYGAGYDGGFEEGLREARRILRGEE